MILNGIQNGFRRGAHNGDDDDGTDREARRRRAALFAGDDDLDVALVPGQLDIMDDDVDEVGAGARVRVSPWGYQSGVEEDRVYGTVTHERARQSRM